ncbi:MAG: hypothetical protein RLZZ262_1721 [Bacteroidota bacterium]|jgi:hypothetical protein
MPADVHSNCMVRGRIKSNVVLVCKITTPLTRFDNCFQLNLGSEVQIP